MIGFVGQRQISDLGGGRAEQHILCKSDEDATFWQEVFPDGKPPVYRWQSEMVLLLGPNEHPLIFQGAEERNDWRKTFLNVTGHVPFVRWTTPKTFTIGSKAPVGTLATSVLDLTTLNDAQLRTRLIELGVEVTQGEDRVVLISKLEDALKLEAATAPG